MTDLLDNFTLTAIMCGWTVLCVLVGFTMGRRVVEGPAKQEDRPRPQKPYDVPDSDYYDEHSTREFDIMHKTGE